MALDMMNPALNPGSAYYEIKISLAGVYGPTCPQHWSSSTFNCGAGFGKMTFWYFLPIN
jgi:hypothetical protein